LDFFAATSSSKGVGDNGGVIGMSSSADLLHYMMASMSFCVALCRKQVFFVKMTQGEDYSEFVKGIRERLAISFNHGASTES
jgi:hypothetical protein